jgi:hypothetical protein
MSDQELVREVALMMPASLKASHRRLEPHDDGSRSDAGEGVDAGVDR